MKEGLTLSAGLREDELVSILELARLVEQEDGIRLKLNETMLRKRPPEQVNDLLYYADGKLVGFFGIYTIVPGEAEISGTVHPGYRRRGIAATLARALFFLGIRNGLRRTGRGCRLGWVGDD